MKWTSRWSGELLLSPVRLALFGLSLMFASNIDGSRRFVRDRFAGAMRSAFGKTAARKRGVTTASASLPSPSPCLLPSNSCRFEDRAEHAACFIIYAWMRDWSFAQIEAELRAKGYPISRPTICCVIKSFCGRECENRKLERAE